MSSELEGVEGEVLRAESLVSSEFRVRSGADG